MDEKIIEVREGAILYEQGAECNSMFLLRSGKIGLFLDYGTPRQFALVEITEPGSSLGEMGLFAEEPRNTTAVALEDSVLSEIDTNHFQEFSERHPDDMRRMMLDLSKRFKTVVLELGNAQEVIYSLMQEPESGPPRKESLQKKLKKFADLFFNIPNDVPPDIYLSNYWRNHGSML